MEAYAAILIIFSERKITSVLHVVMLLWQEISHMAGVISMLVSVVI